MKRAITWMLLLILTGCNSIRTNMWTRAEDDNLHPDACSKLKGIPVMLRVPSHLEVTITETLYLQYQQIDPLKDEFELRVIPLDHPDLDVAANLKYTEKMFLVDPVRVGAGNGSYGFGFGPANANASAIIGEDGLATGHGYVHNANFKANDQTIIQSANLLSTVLSLRPKASGKSGLLDPNTLREGSKPVIKMTRTVAYHRFDLGSPCVDAEVLAFMEQHLNGCHPTCEVDPLNDGVVPPSVVPIPEVPTVHLDSDVSRSTREKLSFAQK